MEVKKMKLHLGCGNRHLEGYVNIDFRETPATDLVHDLSKRLPYPDKSVGLIESYHLIEHLSKEKAVRLIRECHRMLVPGCKIIIECPDLDQAIKDYLTGNEERLVSIFGHQRGSGDAHLWGYNFKRLKRLLERVGFKDIQKKKPQDYHTKSEPCIRVEGIK